MARRRTIAVPSPGPPTAADGRPRVDTVADLAAAYDSPAATWTSSHDVRSRSVPAAEVVTTPPRRTKRAG